MGLQQVPWVGNEVERGLAPPAESTGDGSLRQGQLWIPNTGLARIGWAREGAGLSSASHT